jgi:hypothetical protein
MESDITALEILYVCMYVFWHIDPLLGKDFETNNETTAVARQQPAHQWTGLVAITWEPQKSTRNERGTVGNSVF